MTKNSNLSPYANVDDLIERWGTLETGDEDRAGVLLSDASNYLRQVALNNGKNLDAMIEADETGLLSDNVKVVVVNAVHRVLQAPSDMAPDATNWSQAATPYSESMSFTSGTVGNLYFKAKELDLLGLGSVSGKSQFSLLRGAR